MLRTKRSRMTAGGTFFATALAALIAVSAQPRQAVAFSSGDCPGSRNDGQMCAMVERPEYCVDENGNWFVCAWVTEFYYYDKPENGG